MNTLLTQKNLHKRSCFEIFLQLIAILLVAGGMFLVLRVFYKQPKQIVGLKQNQKALIDSTNSQNAHSIQDQVKDYWTIYGTRGDFTAGIGGTAFALAGFIYLFLSFKKQRESNDVQTKAFMHDKIESRFFELVRLHRENVSELSYTYYVRPKITADARPRKREKEKETVTQRKIFQAFKQQFEQAESELKHFFTAASVDDIYEKSYEIKVSENTTLTDRTVDSKTYGMVDILYLIIFFGVGKDGQETILSLTEKRYKADFIKKVLEYAALKPKVKSSYWLKWATITVLDNSREKFEAILKKRKDSTVKIPNVRLKWDIHGEELFDVFYDDNYEKYYGGHQFRLGHYFRHLYQTVSFINDQKHLSNLEQKSYIRHLRGQLSTDEQIIFFLNSISQLGRIWELEQKDGKPVERQKQLITDYGLIKNIPNNNVIADLKLTQFYPAIQYEGFKTDYVSPETKSWIDSAMKWMKEKSKLPKKSA